VLRYEKFSPYYILQDIFKHNRNRYRGRNRLKSFFDPPRGINDCNEKTTAKHMTGSGIVRLNLTINPQGFFWNP